MVKKTLVLIRHAKSSWSDPTLSDYDRPLNKRGKRDAPFMGRQLKQRRLMPDLFLSSPAKRAKQTAKHIALQLEISKKSITYDESLYHASEYDMLNIIKKVDESVDTLFLVGHNFTITDLATHLTDKYFENVPTAGMVGLQFNYDWEDVGQDKGNLLFYDYPKLHLIS